MRKTAIYLLLLAFFLTACNLPSYHLQLVSPTASLAPTTADKQPAGSAAELVVTAFPATVVSALTNTPEVKPQIPTAQPTKNGSAAKSSPTPVSLATSVPPTPLPATQAPAGDRYAVVGVATDDTLNLRTGPGTQYPITGMIPPSGTDIMSAGEKKVVSGVSWMPVNYQGMTGWVNATYLARQSGTADEQIASTAAQAIQAIKRADSNQLADLVDPQGLRFSAYTYVQPEDLVFSTEKVRQLFSDPTVYHWGIYDGSGAPIDSTFQEYYQRFIYDVDFAQPEEVGYNVVLGGGSRINNISEFYPGSQVVEYYFSGFDPKYGGMDWRTLRLVFLPTQSGYKLAGIVHDEWGP